MEKPDFEEKANQIVFYRWDTENDPDGTKANNFVEDYIEGCEHVWNTHFVPLQEQITKMTTSFIKDQIDGRVYLSADQYQNLAIAAMEQLTNQVKQAESDNKLLREEIESLREQLLEEGERD